MIQDEGKKHEWKLNSSSWRRVDEVDNGKWLFGPRMRIHRYWWNSIQNKYVSQTESAPVNHYEVNTVYTPSEDQLCIACSRILYGFTFVYKNSDGYCASYHMSCKPTWAEIEIRKFQSE